MTIQSTNNKDYLAWLGLTLTGTIFGTLFYLIAHTKTIENTRIENVGTYHLQGFKTFDSQSLTGQGWVNEWQDTITVDKHEKCLRPAEHYIQQKQRTTGTRIKSITYRYGFVGPCDYIEDVVMEQ